MLKIAYGKEVAVNIKPNLVSMLFLSFNYYM